MDGTLVNNYQETIYAGGASSTIIVSGTGKVQTAGNNFNAIASQGNVEIRDYAEISSTTGESINSLGNNSIVTVSGGTISATSENAIIARGRYAKIFVSGGVMSNDATDIYPVIFMRHEGNTDLSLIVSGNAKVIAKQDGTTIYTYGKVEIKENAQIFANTDCAIYCDQTLAAAIISGGLVFAHSSDVNSVIFSPNFTGPTGTGVILAWNKAAGNTTYELHSATDIYKLPETATVFWDENGEENGIAYANGSNTGFIPLEVTLTEEQGISENGLRNLWVYPNPTTGELQVTSYELQVASVEVFDIYGRKQKIEYQISDIGQSDIQINISHLLSGIYFLKVGNETVRVVKH